MPVPTLDNVTNPRQWGYHARLGDYLLRLAPSADRQTVVQRSISQRPTVNTAENPEDFADEYGRTYSQVDFSGGEGLRFAHRRSNPENSNTMYWDSYGVRIDRFGRAELLNTTEELVTGAGLTLPARAAYDGTAIYYSADSPDLTKLTNLTGTPPTSATETTGFTNDVQDVTALGGVVYACDGNEILDNDGGWTQWSNLAAIRLWAVKNRIMSSTGQDLYSDTDGGGPFTPLITLSGSDTWQDVADAGEFVLAAASDGYIYSLQFDGSVLSLVAQSPFAQETPCAIASVQGVVAVLTHQQRDDGTYVKRLWVGSVDTDGVLTNMRVTREWFDLTDAQTPCVLTNPERDGIYTSVHDGTDSALWRYDVEFGATTRDLVMTGNATDVTTILKAEGRFFMFDDAGNVVRETNTRMISGYIVSPLIDFATADKKVWATLDASGDFSGGGTISLAYSHSQAALDEGGSDDLWTAAKTLSNDDDTRVVLSTSARRYLVVRAKITGAAKLNSYVVRALPPLSDEVLRFHVNVSDLLSRPGRAPSRLYGYGDEIWTAIRALQGQSLELQVYDLGLTWVGHITNVATPVPNHHSRGGITRTMQVEFRGTPKTAATDTDGGFGSFVYGGATFGGSA